MVDYTPFGKREIQPPQNKTGCDILAICFISSLTFLFLRKKAIFVRNVLLFFSKKVAIFLTEEGFL